MALEERNFIRAAQYLDAAEDRRTPLWNYLRGQVFLALEQYPEAAACLRIAQNLDPRRCLPLLEQCCLGMEDYKGAYECARKLRELNTKAE
jgi:tetratricopeptide (TPR) repeat protein